MLQHTPFDDCSCFVGGKVEWGHLAAGDAALNAAFNQEGQQYDMIGDEVDHMEGADRQQPGNDMAAPMGRGRDMVQPAWMTNNGAAAAPGSQGTTVPACLSCSDVKQACTKAVPQCKPNDGRC